MVVVVFAHRLGEQFAADAMDFLRCNAMAVSANQFVGGDRLHFSSRDSKGSVLLPTLRKNRTVVLVISQSGQTFPSLKATAKLCDELGDQVFIMVGGEEDKAANCEMGHVITDYHSRDGARISRQSRDVSSMLKSDWPLDRIEESPMKGQDASRSSTESDPPSVFATPPPRPTPKRRGSVQVGPPNPGRDHIFCNLSGVRPCEPSSVAVCATHHTLTEIGRAHV